MRLLIVLGLVFAGIYGLVLGFAYQTGVMKDENARRLERAARASALLATSVFALLWWGWGPPMF